MKPSLQLKLSQQLTMTPQLQQAIRLLQLSSLDLLAEIQTMVEQNPLLEKLDEQREISLEQIKEASEQAQSSSQDQTKWEDRTPYPMGPKLMGGEFEPQRANPTSLRDHLRWQLDLTPFSDLDRIVAATLIDSINDDGFLEMNLNDLKDMMSHSHPIEIDEIEAVLHRIQQFDPISVGARNLRECLLLQIEHLGGHPLAILAKRCVSEHMDLLAKKDYNALKRKLKVDLPTLEQVVRTIQGLNPRPGSEIGSSTPDYVIPDAYVYKHEGQWVVELNPENTPKIRIQAEYAKLIRKQDSSADNQFIKDQLQEARWFLKSLQNRHETLLKVVRCIVEHQRDYFEHGESHMKPLILHDVALKINMHESTVSRVTTQKFVHTPRGTFELKYFFSSQIATQSGEECSSTAIRAHIKKLIAEEDPKKPLSDNKISELLELGGFQVARRTIAKYRESLKIPPSNERKRMI